MFGGSQGEFLQTGCSRDPVPCLKSLNKEYGNGLNLRKLSWVLNSWYNIFLKKVSGPDNIWARQPYQSSYECWMVFANRLHCPLALQQEFSGQLKWDYTFFFPDNILFSQGWSLSHEMSLFRAFICPTVINNEYLHDKPLTLSCISSSY